MGRSVGKPGFRYNQLGSSTRGFYGTNNSADQKVPGSALIGVMRPKPTMNVAGAPMMPMNPYAAQAWLRNTPTALGKCWPARPRDQLFWGKKS